MENQSEELIVFTAKLDFPKRQEKRSGLSCGLQVWQKGQHEEALKEPNAADCIFKR